MTQSSSQPVLSFIGGSGDVDVAARSGGTWTTAKAGNVGKTPTSGDVSAFTTGLGADANGNLAVAWPDMGEQFIEVAQGKVSDLTFTASPLAESTGGWSPSLAVSADGKHAAVAWYDSINKHLDVGHAGAVARRRSRSRPRCSARCRRPPPSGQLPCFPTGATALHAGGPERRRRHAGSAPSAWPCGPAPTSAWRSRTRTRRRTTSRSTRTRRRPKLLGGATSATDIVPPGAGTTYQIKALPDGRLLLPVRRPPDDDDRHLRGDGQEGARARPDAVAVGVALGADGDSSPDLHEA